MTSQRNVRIRIEAAVATATISCFSTLASAQSWDQRALTTNPPAREEHASAIDPTGGVLVFGGQDTNGALADTWRFNGTGWQQLSPANSPGGGAAMAMATDTVNNVVLLFGGTTQNETWTWNGVNWTQASPAQPIPSARTKHAMAFDPIGSRVVLFGGDGASASLGDTWTFASNSWTPVTVSVAPPARENAAMAFDPILGEVVLFGGYARNGGNTWFNDTWSFNSATGIWTNRTTSSAPLAREDHAMAFDVARGRLVMTGGYVPNVGVVADQWEWDRVNWIQSTPARMPAARRAHSMNFGPRSELVVFGGFPGGPPLDDTWTVAFNPLVTGNVPALFDPAAPGCAAPGTNIPLLTSDSAPVLGGSLTLDLSEFPTFFPFAGLSVGIVPVPGSCATLAHVSLTAVQVDWPVPTVGQGSFTLAVPNDPNIAGAVTLWQAVGVDANFQFAFSNQVIVRTGF